MALQCLLFCPDKTNLKCLSALFFMEACFMSIYLNHWWGRCFHGNRATDAGYLPRSAPSAAFKCVTYAAAPFGSFSISGDVSGGPRWLRDPLFIFWSRGLSGANALECVCKQGIKGRLSFSSPIGGERSWAFAGRWDPDNRSWCFDIGGF